MAADSPTTWVVINGLVQKTFAWITQDTAGNVTPQFAPRTNGGPVEVGNPMPTSDQVVGPAVGTTADTAWAGEGAASVVAVLKGIYGNGGGGGGGSATAANQIISNAALGTPADTAWSGTGSSSIVAALKAVWTLLNGTLSVKTQVGSSAGGIGAMAPVPAGSTDGTSLGSPPANTTGVRFYLPPNSSVSYTIAAAQPGAAPTSVFTTPLSTISGNWDEPLSGQSVFVTAIVGSPLFRWR
jgi:hypothetical protein